MPKIKGKCFSTPLLISPLFHLDFANFPILCAKIIRCPLSAPVFVNRNALVGTATISETSSEIPELANIPFPGVFSTRVEENGKRMERKMKKKWEIILSKCGEGVTERKRENFYMRKRWRKCVVLYRLFSSPVGISVPSFIHLFVHYVEVGDCEHFGW